MQDGWSALMLASSGGHGLASHANSGHADIVQLLLDRGAQINTQDHVSMRECRAPTTPEAIGFIYYIVVRSL